MTPGEQLRKMRELLGLSVRAVEAASSKLAERHGNQDYFIPISRLSDIETKGVLPSLYRLYSLAVIYRKSYHEILGLFGIPVDDFAADLDAVSVPATHISSIFHGLVSAKVPSNLDPAFDPASSSSLGRMIVSWGTAPLAYLKKFSENNNFSYGYVGQDDWTMYPLVLPGSFLQVDETRRRVLPGPWRSEYERPIYFVETRQGHICCWCDLNQKLLTVVSHPMSPVPTRVFRLGSEAEVLGQVVGVAMRLDSRLAPEPPK
jgi:transcriptional regulator with XRE-family HTH domain